MMPRPLLLLPIFLLSASLGAAAPICLSDKELLANVAMEYLFAQQAAAKICDELPRRESHLPSPRMMALHREIAGRYAASFAIYRETHRRTYQRLYGKSWELMLEAHRQRRERRMARTGPYSVPACLHLEQLLERRLAAGWPLIQAALDSAFDEARKLRPRCRGRGR
ncbi:MAG: hypothetical protein O7G32_09375 [SAR324 cluster bacterium]|nr:hypothetical protein [SAR324 cluster bacterium]